MDLASGQEVKRLAAGRGASFLALSPDGAFVYCTHIYPLPGTFRTPPESEITVIDTARQMVVERQRTAQRVGCLSRRRFRRTGGLGIAAQLRPKNLIPLAHVEHGWVMGNSLSVFGEDIGEVVQVSIDELDRYYTPPFGVAIAPDKSFAYISTTGSDSVTVIDLGALVRFIRAASPEERRTLANDLSASANYVVARIPVGHAPKGLALSPDGRTLYVANRMGDDVTIIDTAARRATGTIALGGAGRADHRTTRRAALLQRALRVSGAFRLRQLPPGSDLQRPSVGPGARRFRQGYRGQPPAGGRRGYGAFQMERRQSESGDGVRAAHREVLLPLAELQRRGADRPGDVHQIDSAAAQSPPASEWGTDAGAGTRESDFRARAAQERRADSGRQPLHVSATRGRTTRTSRWRTSEPGSRPTGRPLFDTPQLTNTALTAPYLHDGSARNAGGDLDRVQPGDRHGVTNDLQKDELNDLIEYLRIL